MCNDYRNHDLTSFTLDRCNVKFTTALSPITEIYVLKILFRVEMMVTAGTSCED